MRTSLSCFSKPEYANTNAQQEIQHSEPALGAHPRAADKSARPQVGSATAAAWGVRGKRAFWLFGDISGSTIGELSHVFRAGFPGYPMGLVSLDRRPQRKPEAAPVLHS